MSQTIESLIHQFRHEYWPQGVAGDLLDSQIKQQGQQVSIALTLPYAAAAMAEPMASHLQAAMPEKDFSVSFRCHVDKAPVTGAVKHIILVASGKGGVGKSTTAVNLALALAQQGAQVGLLDADVYGPSIPIMLGMEGERPTSADGKVMEPLEKFGVKVNSIGFLIDPKEAAVWRGPMASSALSQLLGETNWGELDYLIVDMPPGTGDIQLTMSQKFPCTGAVVVTTPQNIALADAEKGVSMFNKVNIPVLGIIENMSHFECGSCGAIEHIFGRDGAVAMAQSHQTALLGQIPLQSRNRALGDKGTPVVTTDSSTADLYRQMATTLSRNLYRLGQQNADNGPKINFLDD